MTQTEFARRCGFERAFVSALKGGLKPPEERLAQWADVLELTGSERAEFLEAGWLANAPPEVSDLLARTRLLATDAATTSRVFSPTETYDDDADRITLLRTIDRLRGERDIAITERDQARAQAAEQEAALRQVEQHLLAMQAAMRAGPPGQSAVPPNERAG